MLTPRISRAVNPQKRKLTLKQIRAGFGGKRRQASLKAKRHTHKRRAAAASNPKKKRKRVTAKAKNATRTKVVYRTKYKTRTKKVYVAASKPKARKKSNPKRKRSSNPGPYLATLVPVGNPHRKRKKSMAAKHRKRVSAKGRSGKRNPTRKRRVARRKGSTHRSRNPIGVSSTAVKGVIGAAVGFSAGKKLPPLFGAQMNSSPLMTLLGTALTTAGVVWLARRFAPAYADGAFIGGGMAVLNVAINAWAPSSLQGYSALGDFVPGGFPLPQGPVRYALSAAPMEAPNGSQVNMGAWAPAW